MKTEKKVRVRKIYYNMVKLKIMSTSNKVIFVHHKNRRGNILIASRSLFLSSFRYLVKKDYI